MSGVETGGDGQARVRCAAGGSVEAVGEVETGRTARTGPGSANGAGADAGSGSDPAGVCNVNGGTGIGSITPEGSGTARASVAEGPGYAGEDAKGGMLGRAPPPTDDNPEILERFRAKLGFATATQSEHLVAAGRKVADAGPGLSSDTLERLATGHLANICNDHTRHEAEKNLLKNHILPYFGHLRAGEISADHVADWFKLINNSEALNPAELEVAQDLLIQFRAFSPRSDSEGIPLRARF